MIAHLIVSLDLELTLLRIQFVGGTERTRSADEFLAAKLAKYKGARVIISDCNTRLRHCILRLTAAHWILQILDVLVGVTKLGR